MPKVKTGFFWQESKADENGEYIFYIVILGPERNQKRTIGGNPGGYCDLFRELHRLSVVENTFFRECEGWSKIAAERTIFPEIQGVPA